MSLRATLNLGILAHVDAGKTSLTERLLYAAGVIGELGSVDAGSTQTDSLALERRRGITIKSAVVSFALGGVTINLIDTPGHPEFIAEVERVLGVLDGAVLVVSAVEGVQAQTRVLMRTLRRLRIPTLLFVNKIDRGGAQDERLVRSLAGEARRPSSRWARSAVRARARPRFAPFAGDAVPGLLELLAEHDDALLAAFVDGGAALPEGALRAALAAQTRRALVHPVFFGSAITGAGVDALAAGVWASCCRRRGANAGGPVAGTVFKVDRGERGREDRLRAAVLRHRAGARPACRSGGRSEGKVDRDPRVRGRRGRPAAGRPGRADREALGPGGRAHRRHARRRAAGGRSAPSPRRRSRRSSSRAGPRTGAALFVALSRLAEQDPLIAFRQDEDEQELAVSLYGEVQKEVIEATLADDFGVEATFRETTTICLERPGRHGRRLRARRHGFEPVAGDGRAAGGAGHRRDLRAGGRARLDALGLLQGGRGDRARDAAARGLHGWRVTDCRVTMTHAGYWPRQSHAHATFDKSMSSTAGDFRVAHAARAHARAGRGGDGGAGAAARLPARAPGGCARRGAARARAAGRRARAAGAAGRDVRARGRAAGGARRTRSRASCPG